MHSLILDSHIIMLFHNFASFQLFPQYITKTVLVLLFYLNCSQLWFCYWRKEIVHVYYELLLEFTHWLHQLYNRWAYGYSGMPSTITSIFSDGHLYLSNFFGLVWFTISDISNCYHHWICVLNVRLSVGAWPLHWGRVYRDVMTVW